MFLFKIKSILLISLVTALVVISYTNAKNKDKVEDKVSQNAKAGKIQNVMLQCTPPKSQNIVANPLALLKMMTNGQSFSKSDKIGDRRLLTNIIENVLGSVTQALQTVLKVLDMNDADYNFLWISYKILIFNMAPALLPKLASLEVVTRIYLDRNIKPAKNLLPTQNPKPTGNTTWNLGLIDARCPSITCFGKAITIGFIGTGVRQDHDELRDNWVGAPYGWWNATSPNPDGMTPQDLVPAGIGDTGVAGLAVGKTNGVAYDSQWMACNFCQTDLSYCSAGAMETCGHFMLCPWKSDDKTALDCSQHPDIVVVKSVTDNVGGQLFDPGFNFFKDIIKAWNLLGIISVSGVGDAGPNCNSAWIPGIYDNAFAIGGVDENKTLVHFSSRGPAITNQGLSNDRVSEGVCPEFLGDSKEKCVGNAGDEDICTFIKPDGVAPGQNLVSAFNNGSNAYGTYSGTEFAAAQVAGVIALGMCANPDLDWDYKLAYNILKDSNERDSLDVKGVRGEDETTQDFVAGSNALCNLVLYGICDSFPNNLFGHGLINGCRAFKKAKETEIGN